MRTDRWLCIINMFGASIAERTRRCYMHSMRMPLSRLSSHMQFIDCRRKLYTCKRVLAQKAPAVLHRASWAYLLLMSYDVRRPLSWWMNATAIWRSIVSLALRDFADGYMQSMLELGWSPTRTIAGDGTCCWNWVYQLFLPKTHACMHAWYKVI